MKRVRLNDLKNSAPTGEPQRTGKPSKGSPVKCRKATARRPSEQASPAATSVPSSRLRREKGRWPKGVSGNRAGRRKGSKNRRTVIIEMMEAKLGRKIRDPKKLTAYEAMFFKAIQKSLGGDIRAMSFAFGEYKKAIESSISATPAATAEEDQQAYDAMREKLRREIEQELRAQLTAEITRELKRKNGW